MVKINLKKIYKTILASLILSIGLFSYVDASTLILAPESGTYNVGDTISVRIIVTSDQGSINAVSSKLTFTKDTLNLNSISKTGSIISIWAQEPTFSNSGGIASFEGVLLGGYTGTGAKVATLNFKAKSAGNASIKFSYGAVLANDGEGTNILKSTNEANFTILKAEIKPPTENKEIPPREIKEVLKEAITPKIEQVTPNPATPVITYYVTSLNPIFIYILVVLGILLIILVVMYFRYKYLVNKKLEKIKKISEHSFNILKEDEKLKNLQVLDKDMDEAEKIIKDSINDIEKM